MRRIVDAIVWIALAAYMAAVCWLVPRIRDAYYRFLDMYK